MRKRLLFLIIIATAVGFAPVQASAKKGANIISSPDVPTASGPVTAGGAKVPKGMGPDTVESEKAVITTTPMPLVIRKVTVLIESTPTNSGIEVNGVYIGTTPLQVTLKEGVHHMKVRKEGYLPWVRTVKAYNGLYVSADLVKESTIKRDVTQSATATQ